MNYQLVADLATANDSSALLTVLQTAAIVSVGILTGALLIENAVLVPFWRSLSPHDFDLHHSGFAERLYRFFAPLTAVAVILALTSGLYRLWDTDQIAAEDWLALLGSFLVVSLLAFYGLYFRGANIRLPEVARAGSATQLDAALCQWCRVHQVRTAVSLAGLVLMTLGLTN